MSIKQVIPYDSPEAAKQVTVTLWKSLDGRLFDDEHLARWNSCTHKPCTECGELTSKNYVHCDSCREKIQRERYFAMPEADASEPLVYCLDNDEYYHGLDDLLDQWEGEGLPMVVNCEPEFAPLFDIDNHLCDVLPEDGEAPSELEEAARAFNEAVQAYGQPLSWNVGKTRVRQELLIIGSDNAEGEQGKGETE